MRAIGDDLHEMSQPVSGKNKENVINLSSAELAQRVVKVKHKVHRPLIFIIFSVMIFTEISHFMHIIHRVKIWY